MINTPVLIQPGHATPGFLSSGHLKKRPIPQDLLREASQRLGIIALMGGVLWIVATAIWHLTWPALNPGMKWPGIRGPEILAYASGVTSFAIWFFIRRSKADPDLILRMGLGYMILACLSIALVMHWGAPPGQMIMTQISWIGAVVLMFAGVLPIAPGDMLIAALLAASMNPLGMILTRGAGIPISQELKNGLLMHYPDYLLAFAAAAISQVVTQLGRQVTKAREMGSYQLGELIRRGGMGEVYKATHRMLARPAAIKLIRPEILAMAEGESADLAVRRFHREAEAAANLRSPHTVELFDFGITEDQTLYFVMEFLEGVDLETLVRDAGPLPAGRVVHVLRQACESLAEAHEQGLVHRDIKPANIHLGKVGIQHDFVKVLDFGLVKSVRQEAPEDSLATAVGRTPGTPAYMAPEMAMSEAVDGRADIYALGCVGYFLLTGHIVFDGTSAFQIVAKHLRNDPVPPSLRTQRDIPQALERIILKCLAKKPEDRYQSAMELSRALAGVPTRQWTDDDAVKAWDARMKPSAPEAVQIVNAIT